VKSSRPGRSWQEQLQDSNEHRFQEEKRQQEEQQRTRQAAEKCQRARHALDSLKRETPLYRVNKDGERTYMETRSVSGWQQTGRSRRMPIAGDLLHMNDIGIA